MDQYAPVFRELPVRQVEEDPNQPRKDFGVGGEQNRLLRSIEQYGIEEPIKVSEIEKDRYFIIDGHRRYKCAERLGLGAVPCRVYPKMSWGEFEARRFEIQNNRRNWKPLEKANSLHRIKTEFALRTNKEVAELIHLSVTFVSNSLQLRDLKVDYIELMESYQLSESYRIEFLRLKPKLRKIRNFEVSDIIKILFDKVQSDVIKNAHDFRKLGRIFLRATANEEEIYQFLKSPDMTIDEMDQRTIHTGFSLLIEQAMQKMSAKRQEGVAFSSKEKKIVKQCSALAEKVFAD